MKIFSDKHQQGLTNSLRILFEDRLGGEIYFPIGMDWYPEFWDVQPFKETAQQFLTPNSQPYPHTPSVSKTLDSAEGIHLVESFDGTPPTKGLEFERFKKEKFDLIIASIPQHVHKFLRLRDLYQPQAKLIFQIGNAWEFDSSFPIRNLLASAKIPLLPGFNQVEYHEEFPLDVFRYEPVKNNRKVYSFINCLNSVDLYRPDWELFLQLEKLLPDWEFKSFGGLCRDGSLGNIQDVADKMREATFIFHCKTQGDGMGLSIHQAAAVGRPLITRASDYRGKLAEPLIVDAGTAVTVDGQSPEKIAEIIKVDAVETMGLNIHRKFKEVVDFDAEEQKIREFLDRLQ